MAALRFLIAAFLALTCFAPQLSAAPEDQIAALIGRQATMWRHTVVDLNLVGEYYDDPQNTPIWVRNGRLTQAADELLEALGRASEDGLDEADYLSDELKGTSRLSGDQDAAGFELAMSQAFLTFARDLHAGQTSAGVTASDIVIPRKPVEPVRWLVAARDEGVATALQKLRPGHPQYFQLRQMLRGYRALAERGGWPAIDKGAALKPGMRDVRVVQIRANLQARGYNGIEGREPALYDDDLVSVVEHFQKRHGLDTDGVAGPATISAMNVTADERVAQIIVNLERWRWLPASLGKRNVFVNQAGFEMFFSDAGKVVARHRVIVGKPFHKTPMFSDAISYAEFNPTWTVTPSIAANEMLPKLKKDPGYLARNDYKLYAGWGAGAPEISAWSVDWNAVSAKNFPYKIVQQPGDKNALGVVKFMFPNKFNVYLHDTPSRQLFAETGRAFSHGCIRVQDPLKFADKLFGLDGTMTPDAIRKAVDGGKTVVRKLAAKVPVHLAYFTVWVDDDGLPSFFADVYERDSLVERLLFGSV